MRIKLIGDWWWLILGSLLALAACTSLTVMPAAAPTAAPTAAPLAPPDKPALHFYEFYSPM